MSVVQGAVCPPAMRRKNWRPDDYQFDTVLYKGENSMVVKARCLLSGSAVVIKLYLKENLHPVCLEQVRREIAIHSRVSHPNVLDFYAAFEDADFFYLVLECAEGGDLFAEMRKRSGLMTEHEAVNIVALPLLRALAYLHGQGYIHRDIKPENILFTGKMVLKLADLGFVVDQNVERPVTRAGTVQYMAPELVNNPLKSQPGEYKDQPDLVYNEKVDIWSAAVLVYELLHGFPAFGRRDKEQVIRKILASEPQFFPHIRQLSDEAKDFLALCFRKQPEGRSSTARLIQHCWLQSNSSRHARRPQPQRSMHNLRTTPLFSPASAAADDDVGGGVVTGRYDSSPPWSAESSVDDLAVKELRLRLGKSSQAVEPVVDDSSLSPPAAEDSGKSTTSKRAAGRHKPLQSSHTSGNLRLSDDAIPAAGGLLSTSSAVNDESSARPAIELTPNGNTLVMKRRDEQTRGNLTELRKKGYFISGGKDNTTTVVAGFDIGCSSVTTTTLKHSRPPPILTSPPLAKQSQQESPSCKHQHVTISSELLPLPSPTRSTAHVRFSQGSRAPQSPNSSSPTAATRRFNSSSPVGGDGLQPASLLSPDYEFPDSVKDAPGSPGSTSLTMCRQRTGSDCGEHLPEVMSPTQRRAHYRHSYDSCQTVDSASRGRYLINSSHLRHSHDDDHPRSPLAYSAPLLRRPESKSSFELGSRERQAHNSATAPKRQVRSSFDVGADTKRPSAAVAMEPRVHSPSSPSLTRQYRSSHDEPNSFRRQRHQCEGISSAGPSGGGSSFDLLSSGSSHHHPPSIPTAGYHDDHRLLPTNHSSTPHRPSSSLRRKSTSLDSEASSSKDGSRRHSNGAPGLSSHPVARLQPMTRTQSGEQSSDSSRVSFDDSLSAPECSSLELPSLVDAAAQRMRP